MYLVEKYQIKKDEPYNGQGEMGPALRTVSIMRRLNWLQKRYIAQTAALILMAIK